MSEEKKSLLRNEENHDVAGGVILPKAAKALYVPPGIWIVEKTNLCRILPRRLSYKVMIYLLTFVAYTCYHMTRKPISVVKPVLCPRCVSNKTEADGWYPFNGDHGKTLLGSVDYSWSFSYAIALFFSGIIADRVNLRFFLTLGMLGSAVGTMLMGVAYYASIHHIGYFIAVQIFSGAMQSTGWPGVVSVMSHWFGKQRRGLLMGVWNAHTSLGNILGTIIPSFWANSTADCPNPPWGLSFMVPAIIMAGIALLLFLFLVIDPQHVDLPPPVHHLPEESRTKLPPTRERTPQEEGEDVKEESSVSKEQRTVSNSPPPPESQQPKAVGFVRALKIPGVVEYSLSLFFNKLVSYTFLFWLPLYVNHSHPNLSDEKSDWLATLFDVGGIIGGILTGFLSDTLNARAVSCIVSLILAVPSLWALRYVGGGELWLFMVLLIVCGIFINGPYAIITSAVASDLGTHPTLKNNQNAKAIVTGIIDGTGSIGAALGPLLVGLIIETSWNNAFYLLMVSCFFSALLLMRLLWKDVINILRKIRRYRSSGGRCCC